MKTDQAETLINMLSEGERLDCLLDNYIVSCSEQSSLLSDESHDKTKDSKKGGTRKIFPNLAGFCRYLGISTDELEPLARKQPTLYGRMLTVLEDEALNSNLSPTLLSSYLKKRLGYDASTQKPSADGQLEIRFEHDIIEDGE